MAATADTDSVHDHMTRLRMKMVQQKIQNEKERIVNRSPSPDSGGTNNEIENQARLQQAMLRRQELLDKIRREQLMNEENKRPRTYSARRRYTPSPLPIPPSRRSLPDFARNNYYYQQPDTNRSKPDMSQVKHVIEHRIATPRHPHHLPPINQPYPHQQGQQGPGVVIHAPPPPQIMHQQQQGPIIHQVHAPAPQVIQGPPQHVVQMMPNPVIQNLNPTLPPEKQGMFNKADMMEMMMMQNAQMHHMVMQQLMVSSLPRANKSPVPPHQHLPVLAGPPTATLAAVEPLLAAMPRGGAVHHHHYSNPPSAPMAPAIQHYSTMQPMEIRGGYPLRGYASGYTGPGYGPTGDYYDDGTNYYTYH